MSYIDENITIEEFLGRCSKKSTRDLYIIALSQFDHFCNDSFEKSGTQVLEDISEEIKKSHDSNKLIIVLNRFVQWCLVDHPEIKYRHGRDNLIKRKITAKNPNSIKKYIGKIRIILEDVWNVEINSSKVRRQVKIPDANEEDVEPFTKEQMRLFLDSVSNEKRLQFMVLKDTGMRIRELCQIRKSDVIMSERRIRINIQARYTKKRRARIGHITKETELNFLRLLDSKNDDDLLFTKNEDPDVAEGAFQNAFSYYREKIGNTHPEFIERYQSNGRHKKTIHSIRSYTSTQCAKAIDEAWGHGYIGHKKYLEQYIRDQDQFLDKFIRSENHLMVYDTIEVVDQDERVKKLELEQEQTRQDMQSLTKIMNQLSEIREDNARKEQEIEHLRQIIQGKTS